MGTWFLVLVHLIVCLELMLFRNLVRVGRGSNIITVLITERVLQSLLLVKVVFCRAFNFRHIISQVTKMKLIATLPTIC